MASRDDDDNPEMNDRELPDEADMDDDDGNDEDDLDTEPCPYCGKPVYAQADLCPHCRSYISFENAPKDKPWWLIIGVVVCLLIVLLVWML